MIALIEEACGREAKEELLPQPGDVRTTSADISAIQRNLDLAPTIPINATSRP